MEMLKANNDIEEGDDVVFVSGVRDITIKSQFQMKLIEV